jgi:hypothetical protein
MTKALLLIFILFCQIPTFSQEFKLTGKITNTKLEPIPYATIQIKDYALAASSKQDGSYSITLESGSYEFVVSLLGYKSQTFTIVIDKKDEVQNVILEDDKKFTATDVVVRGQRKDKSEEYIRNVIKNKEAILNAVTSYSASLYIKAIQENTSTKARKLKPNQDSLNAILQQMSMAEIQMQLDFSYPDKVKETRNGVSKRGNPESLFYLSTTEGDFNLYNNLMKIRAITPMPFLSPISYSGLVAYRYKTIRTIKKNNRTIYTIQFRPTKMGNALLTGEVDVMDSSWVILNSSFELPKYHLTEYNHFKVEQEYNFVNDTAWLLTKQKMTYDAKEGKVKSAGSTVVNYNNYELNKIFPKKYFGMELSSTSQEAYERDSSFWETARTEPLTEKEVQFVRFKDSVYRATHNQKYYDSIDAVTNKITLKKVTLDGITFYNRAKEKTVYIGSLTNLYEPFSPGGGRIGYNASALKVFKSKKDIRLLLFADYGIRNKDLNGTFMFNRMYNPFNRGYYTFNGGRTFDAIFGDDNFVNVIQKRNIFRKYHGTIGHGVELLNGLFLNNEMEIAVRESIANFKFNDWIEKLTDTAIRNQLLISNTPQNFATHTAFYNNITLSYTPFQTYIREPKQKVILGSKWPTFSLMWRKGVPGIFKSTVDYDYLEFRLSQTLQLGTTGISKYTFRTGKFLNKNRVELADRKYMRAGDPIIMNQPERYFQNLDSTFEVNRDFYEFHYMHEFNGAILNKIPLIKKLQLKELAGAGFLYAGERKLTYFEAFVGIETKPFRLFGEKFKLGFFVVGSVANQFQNPVQLKFSIRQWDRRSNRWN